MEGFGQNFSDDDGRLTRNSQRAFQLPRNRSRHVTRDDLARWLPLGGPARCKIGGGSSKPEGVDHTPSTSRLPPGLESEGMVEKVRSCLPADAQAQLGRARGRTGDGGGCKQPHCSCPSAGARFFGPHIAMRR